MKKWGKKKNMNIPNMQNRKKTKMSHLRLGKLSNFQFSILVCDTKFENWKLKIENLKIWKFHPTKKKKGQQKSWKMKMTKKWKWPKKENDQNEKNEGKKQKKKKTKKKKTEKKQPRKKQNEKTTEKKTEKKKTKKKRWKKREKKKTKKQKNRKKRTCQFENSILNSNLNFQIVKRTLLVEKSPPREGGFITLNPKSCHRGWSGVGGNTGAAPPPSSLTQGWGEGRSEVSDLGRLPREKGKKGNDFAASRGREGKWGQCSLTARRREGNEGNDFQRLAGQERNEVIDLGVWCPVSVRKTCMRF